MIADLEVLFPVEMSHLSCEKVNTLEMNRPWRWIKLPYL